MSDQVVQSEKEAVGENSVVTKEIVFIPLYDSGNENKICYRRVLYNNSDESQSYSYWDEQGLAYNPSDESNLRSFTTKGDIPGVTTTQVINASSANTPGVVSNFRSVTFAWINGDCTINGELIPELIGVATYSCDGGLEDIPYVVPQGTTLVIYKIQ
jgi:hypothetical protein